MDTEAEAADESMTEPPTLRSIPSAGVAVSSAGSPRRSYSCYNCNYSFHISPTANTASTSPSSFRCPRCHHRHLIPHHTVSPAPPPPPPLPPPPPPPSSITPMQNSDYSPAINTYDYRTSDDSESDEDLGGYAYVYHSYTGTSKSFIDSLPVTKFPLNPSPSAAQSCSICLDDFVVDSEINELPCNHCFHKDCIVQWLEKSNTCPLCRHKLPSGRMSEEGIDRRTDDEFEPRRYYSGLVVEFPSVRRASDGANEAVSGSDIRNLILYGGERSGRGLDAMHDEDGDTFMMDA